MLLPQELRNYSFTRAVRGYTASEVEEYIEFLIGKYEELYRENNELDHKLSIAMKSLDALRARAAKIALLDAEVKKAAAKILADAEKQRRRIIEDATEYADRLVAEADAHVTSQENRFKEMQDEVAALRDTLFAAYSSHIDRIEELTALAAGESFNEPIPAAVELAQAAEEIVGPGETEEASEIEEIEKIEEVDEVGKARRTSTPRKNCGKM